MAELDEKKEQESHSLYDSVLEVSLARSFLKEKLDAPDGYSQDFLYLYFLMDALEWKIEYFSETFDIKIPGKLYLPEELLDFVRDRAREEAKVDMVGKCKKGNSADQKLLEKYDAFARCIRCAVKDDDFELVKLAYDSLLIEKSLKSKDDPEKIRIEDDKILRVIFGRE